MVQGFSTWILIARDIYVEFHSLDSIQRSEQLAHMWHASPLKNLWVIIFIPKEFEADIECYSRVGTCH